MTEIHDPFGARRTIDTPLGERVIYHLDALAGLGDVEHLPYSIKVLLESALRNHDGRIVTDDDVHAAARYDATTVGETEIAFKPARVVLQDFTGVPAVVDLAAMRSAVVRMTGNETAAAKVNPQVPADLVVDHSVQVDAFNSPNALRINSEIEFERNMERWLATIPPGIDPIAVYELAYIELKMSCCWLAQSYVNPTMPMIAPLISRSIFTHMLHLGHDMRRRQAMPAEVIRRMWPELLEVPINRYGDWRDIRDKAAKVYYFARNKLMR